VNNGDAAYLTVRAATAAAYHLPGLPYTCQTGFTVIEHLNRVKAFGCFGACRTAGFPGCWAFVPVEYDGSAAAA